MAHTLKTRISFRKDSIANWNSTNPTLANGELAIVILEDGNQNLKFGNGISSFQELPYLYQSQLKTDKLTTKDITAKSIAQGYNVKATPTSFATGIFSHADGNFDVVHGIEAKAKEGDDYAFVFNGINLPLDDQNFYQSHGAGSFNVNPLSGLSGFYVGESSLADQFYTKSQTSSAIEISNGLFEISDYIDGFEKAVYGEDKNRYFIEIPYIDPTVTTDTANLAATLNTILEAIGSETRLTEESTYDNTADAVREIYEVIGQAAPTMSTIQQLIDAINNISTEPQTSNLMAAISTFAASPAGQKKMLFGGSAQTNKSMKAYVIELNKRLLSATSDLKLLSGDHYSFKSSVGTMAFHDANDYYVKTQLSTKTELQNKFDTLSTYDETKFQLSNDGYLTAHQPLANYYKKSETSSAAELSSKFGTLSTYAETRLQLSNDGYLTAHQSLANYYKKSQTSSAVEISNAIKNIDLSEYYKKSETSSAIELSNAISALRYSIDFIGNDYLIEADREDILNRCIERDEIKFYYGPGKKDISLSIDAGNSNPLVQTVVLSDFYLASETSSAAEISNALKNIDLKDYYKKSETSSSVELSSKFNTLSTYSQIKVQLSNDNYLTSHQSLANYYKQTETSSNIQLNSKFATLSTYSQTKNQLSSDGYLTSIAKLKIGDETNEIAYDGKSDLSIRYGYGFTLSKPYSNVMSVDVGGSYRFRLDKESGHLRLLSGNVQQWEEKPVVQQLTQSSLSSEIPSAKCMYDILGNIDAILQNILEAN